MELYDEYLDKRKKLLLYFNYPYDWTLSTIKMFNNFYWYFSESGINCSLFKHELNDINLCDQYGKPYLSNKDECWKWEKENYLLCLIHKYTESPQPLELIIFDKKNNIKGMNFER